MPRTILAVALLLVSVFANAQFRTGSTFIEHWRAWQKGENQGLNSLTEDEWRDANQYRAYIIGVNDGIWWATSDPDLKDICIPDGTTTDQLYKVVSNYLEGNPTNWNRTGMFIVWDALRKAWPCNN